MILEFEEKSRAISQRSDLRQIERSALVPHSAEQMFDLVDDVEAYPQFLPWCVGAAVDRVEGDEMIATLEVKRAKIRQRFSTRNRRRRPEEIAMYLEAGPFTNLQGGWRFQALNSVSCKVILQLEFEFSAELVGALFAPLFEDMAASMVAAFVDRARAVYGR